MFVVPPVSAIQEFQVLYEHHYGVILPVGEVEQKLSALLGLLAAARSAAVQDRAGVVRRLSSGHGQVTP